LKEGFSVAEGAKAAVVQIVYEHAKQPLLAAIHAEVPNTWQLTSAIPKNIKNKVH
jgi:hypothetical protein